MKIEETEKPAEPGLGDLFELRLTPFMNAVRMSEALDNRLLYCDPWNRWLIWDGARWKHDDTRQIEFLALAFAERIRREAEQESDPRLAGRLRTWAIASTRQNVIAETLKTLRSMPGVASMPDDFDRHPLLVNFKNCTVDVEARSQRAHRPEDKITRVLPVNYDPLAVCPTWEAHL